MSKNQQPEAELVELFQKLCELDSKYHFIHKETGKNSVHMDVEVIFEQKEYLRLEAKANTSNFSQAVLLIFGNIIKGRSLPLAERTNSLPVSYGVLIKGTDEYDFQFQWNKINVEDWNKFGEDFGAKYICLVNDDSIELKNWKDYVLETETSPQQ